MSSDQATTAHMMRRPHPGATRCADCGMTAGTKAHREARAALAATRHAEAPAPAGDQAEAPAADMPVFRLVETEAEIIEMYACWETRDLARDVPSFAAGARDDAASGRALDYVIGVREACRRAIALRARADMPAG